MAGRPPWRAARSNRTFGSVSVIAADPDGHEAALAENDAALRKAGHWGVPTMVFEGELFFGQDRVETLRWRMAQRLNERVAKS